MITIATQNHPDQQPASRLLLLINAAATYSWCLASVTSDTDLAAAYSLLACDLGDLSHIAASRLQELSPT